MRTSITAVYAATAGAVLVAASPAIAAGTWAAIPNYWSQSASRVDVTDVWAVPGRSWTVGNESTPTRTRPVVQDCTGNACTRVRLPEAGGNGSWVAGVTGTSAIDVWAVGSTSHPFYAEGVAWHFDGAVWSVHPVLDTLTAFQSVESVSPTESYGLGYYDYEDGVTSVVMERVGSSWTNLTRLGSPALPGPCAPGYYNDFRDLAVVAGAPVVVGACDGTPVVLKRSSPTTWRQIESGLPADAAFTQAAVVANQLWVQGRAADGTLAIYQRAYGSWQSVPTTGIAPGASIADLAGSRSGAAWMVGTQNGVAVGWQFLSGRWTAAPLPAALASTELRAVWLAAPWLVYAAGRDGAKPVPKQGVIVRLTT